MLTGLVNLTKLFVIENHRFSQNATIRIVNKSTYFAGSF